jgi:ATP-dependent Lon protease
MLELLTEYYVRVGQGKTRDQLNLIVERYRGKEDLCYEQLEKKYGQPVRRAAPSAVVPPSQPAIAVVQPSAATPSDFAAGFALPDVFKAAAEVPVVQTQPDRPANAIDCLNANLSALYQQSAPAKPVLAANGANYSDLLNMEPSMESQQMAWMQQQQRQQQQQMQQQQMQQQQMQQQVPQMDAFQQMQMLQQMQQQQMQQMQQPQMNQQLQQQMLAVQQMQQQMQQMAAMQTMAGMTPVPGAQQFPGMQQGYGAQ